MRASRESGFSGLLFEPCPTESTPNHCIWPDLQGYPQDVAGFRLYRGAVKCTWPVGMDLDPQATHEALLPGMVPRDVQSTVGKNGNSVSVTQLGAQIRSRPRDCMR